MRFLSDQNFQSMADFSCYFPANDGYSGMEIVRTKRYLKDLKKLRVTTAEQEKLEYSIATNPLAGDVIPDLAGVRKVRFGYGGKGKRGGGRVLYILRLEMDLVFMLQAFGKGNQADLSPDQKKMLRSIVKEIKDG